jgi:hypothetical protein
LILRRKDAGRALAAEAQKIEDAASDPGALRRALRDAIERRYTAPAAGADFR